MNTIIQPNPYIAQQITILPVQRDSKVQCETKRPVMDVDKGAEIQKTDDEHIIDEMV